jgi:Ca2+-binding RTX toxin-like protein
VVLVTEANASGAPLDLYDARSGQVVQLPALAGIVNADFNRGVADVTTVSYGPTTSPSSGYVAVSPGNGAIYVLDTQLHLVKDLTPLFPSDPTSHLSDTITSVQFTDNGRQLFVWDQTTNKISVIDTQTWQRVTTLDAPTGHGETPPDFQQWGVMAFANHDYDLIVDDRDALHVIDLAASLHINLSGTADNDIENGGVGTDSLSGGGGNDTITGGLDGADTLDGGAGDDSLVAGSGPSVMLGGDGADTLNAGYNGAKVSGGAGNDFIELTGASTLHLLSLTELDGDSGDDRFLVYAFPNEALTIDGGTGHNSLEMHYFGYENPAPIVVHLNGDASGGAWVGANLQTVTILDHVANVVGGDASETITAPGVIAGGGGDDFLVGSNPQAQDNPVTTMTLTGADTINGGLGNDTINGLSGVSYLRGDEGNDSINGGSDFDDINGNMGNDTAHGNAGDDWVVGGKDNDSLFGDAGGDVVWGNLGNDTLDGGDGNDQVRGGQGDDSVSGGAGDDYVSGDRGNDTITGGSGADLFHDSQDAGIDRVLDFHIAEGDRVMLDPGTTYTVSQVGSDTIIDMGAGNQMILVGVQMSTLAPGWIFLG